MYAIRSYYATAVEALDKRLPQTLITLGATPRQMLWATVVEARYSIILARNNFV